MDKTWRLRALRVIRQVIADHPGASEIELKKALYDAYPFHMRKYWPYKVWCEEVRVALGKRKKPPRAAEVDPNHQVLPGF